MEWFEDLPLDFTRTETREAERLLIAGYPTTLAGLALAQDTGLDLARLNQSIPVKFLIREMMTQARGSDRLLQLIVEVLSDPGQAAIHASFRRLIAGQEALLAAKALEHKPSIARLARLPASLEVWPRGEQSAKPLALPGLEKIVNAAAGFADVAVFRERLAEAEVRTARIEIGGKANGTGFLVGESLLLTNWHVVKANSGGAIARFDHKTLPGGTMVGKGRAVAFATDWLVTHSPHDDVRVETGPEGPLPGTWDFALVRLCEPVASQGLGPHPAGQTDVRGHFELDGSDYDFERGEPILIVGHPAGRPMQLSYASPSGAALTRHSSRLRYQTNTESGSSGSPVFNRDWRVVALHQGSGPTTAPGEFDRQTGDFNQGVVIGAVVNALMEQLKGQPALAELGLE